MEENIYTINSENIIFETKYNGTNYVIIGEDLEFYPLKSGKEEKAQYIVSKLRYEKRVGGTDINNYFINHTYRQSKFVKMTERDLSFNRFRANSIMKL